MSLAWRTPGREVAVGRRTTVLYGTGALAFGVKDLGFRTLLLLYYNQVIGLPASQVATALMVALIVDAVLDPIIGELSDNWRSRWKRRHPFMYAAAIPSALAYLYLWLPPEGWSDNGTLIYMFVLAVSVRSVITLYEVPSVALVPELSRDYDQRTSILGMRSLFYFLGGTLLTVLTFRVFLQPTDAYPIGQLNPAGYRLYAYVAAALMFVSIVVSALGTHHCIPHLEEASASTRRSALAVLRAMRASLSNRSFLTVASASFCKAAALGISGGLSLYMSTYFWKLSAGQIGILALDALVAAALAFALATSVGRRFGKKRVAMFCYMVSLVVAAWPPLLRMSGVALQDGSPMILPVLFVNGFLFGALGIASSILAGSMIADCVEDSQRKTGRRSEGLLFAANSLIGKVVSGFGVFGAGIVLSLVEFPEQIEPAKVPVATVNQMFLTYIAVVGVLYLVGVTLLSRYRITRATHARNVEALSENGGPK